MKELEFAQSIAKKAGKIMLRSSRYSKTMKYDGSIVTSIDNKINRMVIAGVKQEFPSHAVLGEEENYTPKHAIATWVCDPIDGTLPYSMGVPTCAFSLALLDDTGMPIIAVVYDPYLKNMYWAARNKGAFVNATPLRVNKTQKIEDALIGNSGRSSTHVNASNFKSHLYTHCYRPVILHSAVYEAMLVASGSIAATVMTGSAAHDAVSAKLIVEESGGKVTNLFGSEQRYDHPITGAIISNGQIHESIVKLAKEFQLN